MKDREGAGLFPHAIDLLKRVDTSAMRDSFNLRASRSKGAHLGFRGTSKKSAVDSRSKGTVLSRIAESDSAKELAVCLKMGGHLFRKTLCLVLTKLWKALCCWLKSWLKASHVALVVKEHIVSP